MREENGIIEIERAIDKLSRHHIRHIKVCIRHIKVCIRHIKVCLKASYKAYQGTYTNPVCDIRHSINMCIFLSSIVVFKSQGQKWQFCTIIRGQKYFVCLQTCQTQLTNISSIRLLIDIPQRIYTEQMENPCKLANTCQLENNCCTIFSLANTLCHK